KKIQENGHEIANHGYFHKDQDILSLDGNLKEIKDCHNIVKQTLNVEMNLFAPPSGAYSSKTITAANNLNYKTIMWTKDTIDWRDQDANVIFSRATNNAKGGDLVLMHPTKATLEALDKIIKELKTQNFILTTVSDCLS
ncbi:MAG: polysaccharide deacetylase family protein, partial [Clostridia bacterium]|nr:polysaccharide deacetylase family protein [Clostridia bacterium]